MHKTPARSMHLRRVEIIALLAEHQHLTASDIHTKLTHRVAERTLFSDLQWLAKRFPRHICHERGVDGRERPWRLIGQPPVLLPTPITDLSQDELTALIAARGLLRAPDSRSPGWERRSTEYGSDLSQALHELLLRSGIADEAKTLAPQAIGISRFGVPTHASGLLALLVRALRIDQAVRFRYRSRGSSDDREVHAWPVRLVLIKGEWYCFAWAPVSAGSTPMPPAGKIKQYALSRITADSLSLTATKPTGAPPRPPHHEVDDILASGFHATGGGPRTRVMFTASPHAWPHIIDRTWGEAQTIDQSSDDLPHGWHRIAFSTTGLDECRHWLMSFGAEIRVEAPEHLRTWLADQARAILANLESKAQKIPATPVAGIGE